MARRRYVSLAPLALKLAILGAAATPAAAQSWINPAGGTWSAGANWSGGVMPPSLNTTQLLFGSPVAGGYTTTNDTGTNPFIVNRITFANDSNAAITVTNAASNSLQFAGANATIAISGAGAASITGTSVDLASNLTINGLGDGAFTISSQITGGAGLVINRTSPSFQAITALTSATANSFSGGVNLTAGILSVSVGSALGGGTLAVNTTGTGFAATGDLRASAAVTLPNVVIIAAGGTLNVLTGSAITFSGAVSGGALCIGTPVTAGAAVLQASSGVSGVSMPGGTLTLNTAGAIPTAGLTIPLGRGATIALDNITGVNLVNRLAPTTTLAMSRSVFTLNANATAGNSASQTFAAITGEGQNVLTISPSAGNPTALAVGNLARANRGTFFFGFTSTGGSIGGTPAAANVSTVTFTTINGAAPASSLIGGGGAAGTSNISILPFVVSDTNSGGSGNSFATYDAVNGLRPLSTTGTEYATLSLARQANPATNNVRLLAADSQPGVANAITVNSLALAGASIYGYGGTTGSLTVTSGAILASSAGSQAIATGTLNFGAAEGQFFLSVSPIVVFSQVTGTNGLTLNGASGITADNNLQLLNPANTFTGPITVNAGRLTVRDDTALGNAANSITLNGGTFDFQTFDGSIARNFTVGAAGGGIASVPFGGSATGSGQRMTLSGAITGAGPLRFNATASGANVSFANIVLSGNNAGYMGEMAVDSGFLSVDSDARLGGGSRFLLSGGTLWATGAGFATGKIFDMDASSSIRTDAGTTLTLNDRINPLAAALGLTKTGTGTLVLASPAMHTGTTVLGTAAGTSQIAGGDLVLQGNGTLTATSGFTANNGRLVLSNGAVNNTNRVANVNVTINGGGIRLEGNAAAASGETLGILTLGANFGSTIEIAPVAAQTSTLIFSTNGAATNPLTLGAGSTLIVGGTGLGLTGASRVQFLSTVAPTLTNNILAGVFGNDGTAVGQVTTGAVTGGVGLRLLNTGTEYVTSFAAAAATDNVRITAPQAIAASVTVNSGFVSGTALTVNAGNALTISTGNLILSQGSSLAGAGQVGGESNGLRIYTSGTSTDVITSSVDLGVAGGLTVSKTGPAILSITGPVATASTFNVQQGTFRIGAGGSLPTTATVNVQSGATFDLNGNSTTLAGLTGIGTIQLGAGAATLDINTTGTANNFGGTILGTGTIAKSGTGTLRFTYTANFTQPLAINGGTVAFGQGGGAPALPLVAGGDVTMADGTLMTFAPVGIFARNININVGAGVGGASVTFAGGFGTTTSITGNILVALDKTLTMNTTTSGQGQMTGNITGQGNVIYNSVTNLAVAGNNTYTGTTTITSSGVIAVGSNSAFGNGGALSFTAATNALATYNGNRTVANPVAFGGTMTLTGTFDLVFNGNATLGTQAGTARTFTINGGGRLGVTNLVDGTTATAVTKTGGGSMTLAGNNAYSGGTTVTAGSYILVGGAQLSGAGAVNVGGAAGTARAILGGVGSVTGATTLNATGTISPGAAAAAGGLSFAGGVTFNAASTYHWELASNTVAGPGTNWDRVSATAGVVTVTAGAVLLPSFIGAATVPTASDPFWQATRRWDNVVDLTGGSTLAGSAFTIDNSLWASAGAFTTIQAVAGTGVALLWTPVPEPTHIFALFASVTGLVLLGRRRSAGAQA